MRLISARSILQSIRDGSNRDRLMREYDLSPESLSIILKRIEEERDERALRIILDFLSGMQIPDIATRNGFAVDRFVEILRMVFCLKLWGPSDSTVEENPSFPQDADAERRRHPRIRCPVLMPQVRDASRQERACTVLDISEGGVALGGIVTQLHEEKTFLLSESEFDLPDPIALTCACRWTCGTENFEFGESAGFEIVSISEADKRYLRSLIDVEEQMSSPQQFIGT